jgi:hypothetical protein
MTWEDTKTASYVKDRHDLAVKVDYPKGERRGLRQR